MQQEPLTDTHINGTDCAALIASARLLELHLHASLTSSASPARVLCLSISVYLYSCLSVSVTQLRRPHPKPTRIRQPVLSALRQWMQEEEEDCEWDDSAFIHKNLRRSLCCFIMSDGWVRLPPFTYTQLKIRCRYRYQLPASRLPPPASGYYYCCCCTLCANRCGWDS